MFPTPTLYCLLHVQTAQVHTRTHTSARAPKPLKHPMITSPLHGKAQQVRLCVCMATTYARAQCCGQFTQKSCLQRWCTINCFNTHTHTRALLKHVTLNRALTIVPTEILRVLLPRPSKLVYSFICFLLDCVHNAITKRRRQHRPEGAVVVRGVMTQLFSHARELTEE